MTDAPARAPQRAGCLRLRVETRAAADKDSHRYTLPLLFRKLTAGSSIIHTVE